MAIQERKWLKNIITGGIFPETPQLLKLADLVSCSSPEVEKETPGMEHDMITKVVKKVVKKVTKTTSGMSKDEGEALVKGWFGRNVTQVTKGQIAEYAKSIIEKEISTELTKLEMVEHLASALAVEEE